MEYIDKFDNVDQYITKVLKNDIIFIVFIVLLILIATFINEIRIVTIHLPSNINLSDPFVLILWILSIAYLLNKDLRIGVLLSLIFLILYEKHKQNAINKQVLHTYMKNLSIEQRLEILEDQKK